MAIQKLDPVVGLGSLLGKGLGEGLAGSTESLLKQRLQTLAQNQKTRQETELLRPAISQLLPGISPQEQQSFAQLAATQPTIFKELIKQRGQQGIVPSQVERVGDLWDRLDTMEQRGLSYGFTPEALRKGESLDTYNATGEELYNVAHKIDPSLPKIKASYDAETRRNILNRYKTVLEDVGIPIGDERPLQGNVDQLQQNATETVQNTITGQPQEPQQYQDNQLDQKPQQTELDPFTRVVGGGLSEAGGGLAKIGGRALSKYGLSQAASALSGAGNVMLASDLISVGEDVINAATNRIAPLAKEDEIDDIVTRLEKQGEPGIANRLKESYEQEKRKRKNESWRLGDFLPSSRNVGKIIKYATGDLLKPTTEGEQLMQETVKRFTDTVGFTTPKLAKAAIATATGLGGREIARNYKLGPVGETVFDVLGSLGGFVGYGFLSNAKDWTKSKADQLWGDFVAENENPKIDARGLVNKAKEAKRYARKFPSDREVKNLEPVADSIIRKTTPRNVKVYQMLEGQFKEIPKKDFSELDLTAPNIFIQRGKNLEKATPKALQSLRQGQAKIPLDEILTEKKLIGARLFEEEYRKNSDVARMLGELWGETKDTITDPKNNLKGLENYKTANQMYSANYGFTPIQERLANLPKSILFPSAVVRKLSDNAPTVAFGLGLMKTAGLGPAVAGTAIMDQVIQAAKFYKNNPQANEFLKQIVTGAAKNQPQVIVSGVRNMANLAEKVKNREDKLTQRERQKETRRQRAQKLQMSRRK